MKDYQKHLEKLRADAAECLLISDQATNPEKQELFDVRGRLSVARCLPAVPSTSELTVRCSLPVYPQLRTCRCTAPTDAMCQQRSYGKVQQDEGPRMGMARRKSLASGATVRFLAFV